MSAVPGDDGRGLSADDAREVLGLAPDFEPPAMVTAHRLGLDPVGRRAADNALRKALRDAVDEAGRQAAHVAELQNRLDQRNDATEQLQHALAHQAEQREELRTAIVNGVRAARERDHAQALLDAAISRVVDLEWDLEDVRAELRQSERERGSLERTLDYLRTIATRRARLIRELSARLPLRVRDEVRVSHGAAHP